MDIRKSLLEEHSKIQTEKIRKWIDGDSNRFAELMKIFFHDDYKIVQRAAWVMSECILSHPDLIKGYIKPLLKYLNQKKIHEAVRRNVFRVFQYIDFDAETEGEVYSSSYLHFTTSEFPIAIRVLALTVMANIATKHKDLKNEVETLIALELQKPHTPALNARVKFIYKNIFKDKKNKQ
jgi:hypothetical protein